MSEAVGKAMELYKQGRIPLSDVDEIARFSEFLRMIGPGNQPRRQIARQLLNDGEIKPGQF